MFQTDKIKTMVVLLLLLLNVQIKATPYYAFSLRRAKELVSTSAVGHKSDIYSLGGMNRFLGFIYDKSSNDVILIGQISTNDRKVTLDDLVVAMRAILQHKDCPKVSIDKVSDTYLIKKQKVVFGGGIQDTQIGQDLLDADILLKKLALGIENAPIWGLTSYFDLSLKAYKAENKLDNTSAKFWFVPAEGQVKLVTRNDVFVIRNVDLAVKTQIMSINGKAIAFNDSSQNNIRDLLGDEFSDNLTSNYDDLCEYYPELKRLAVLFDIVALASGFNLVNTGNYLDYWIHEFKVKSVPTLVEYPLVVRTEQISTEKNITLQLDGGIELKALISRLRSGDVLALKKAVLTSRPGENDLIWRVPIDSWALSDNPDFANTNDPSYYQAFAYKFGTDISRSVVNSKSALKQTPLSTVVNHIQPGLPRFSTSDNFKKYSSDIGGVLLSNTASIVKADASDNWSVNFSFVLANSDATANPAAVQQFITSLWAVYFSKTPPGISIDPIAPGVEKHLVRYIGDVINSDLGRVMREADYTMKKWAVGTERPNIAGFKNVDDITATRGHDYVGASRRFWFVPEEMSFTQSENMLLFNGGRMTLKTEYILQNKATRANPADEEFARFFTEHYMEIAQKYPEYQELFDYAKLVSLAQYLKQNNVPLLWYLLANKDLVMTEDSPGVVDELAKGSKYFDNIEIRGGVEMDPAKGRYVYDQSAVAAINKAIAAMPSSSAVPSLSSSPRKTVTPVKTFSFDLNNNSYTVVPQHSLTSGKDRRGIRYQTDLAFRNGDLPGLEMVRYFNPAQLTMSEFGDGWHLLIPYQIVPADSEKVEFQHVRVPKRMAFTNLLSGEKEVLEFSRNRYSIVGWVPDSLQTSQVVGLFLMTDVSYRLADKIGNEFWFDQAGHMTDMLFGDEHHYQIKYGVKEMPDPSLENSSFDLANNEYTEFLNAYVPQKIKLTGSSSGLEEHFTFNSNRYDFAGYIPDDENNSKFKIAALMSDGSLQLVDKNGHEHRYDPAFNYTASLAEAVQSYAMGGIRVEFQHEIKNGSPVIVEAKAYRKDATTPFIVINYHYDSEGRLCRVEHNSEAKG